MAQENPPLLPILNFGAFVHSWIVIILGIIDIRDVER